MASLGACQSRACASACGLTCGGWGLLPGPQLSEIESTAGCQSCLTSTGCAQLAACVGDESCLASRLCANACIPYDLVCQANCGAAPPGVSALLPGDGGVTASNAQLLSSCNDECNAGKDWTCTSNVVWPSASTATITFPLIVYDFASGNPLAGATVTACAKQDGTCAKPIPPSPQTTSGNGLATLELPTQPWAFDGYLVLKAPGHLTALFFYYPYPAESGPSAPGKILRVPMVDDALIMSDAQVLGVPYDTSRGEILVAPFDCEGVGAAGVSFTAAPLGPAAVPYYFFDNIPTRNRTSTQGSANSDGGGFVNVDPGAVTVESHANGKVVSTITVQVWADAMTIAYQSPTPQ
jgi:hypothetical protein